MFKEAPSVKIGTSLRDNIVKEKENQNKPGPSNYKPSDNFVKTHAASWRFGTSSRPSLSQDRGQLPGPNKYNIPSKMIEGPKYVMGVKTSLDKIDDIPGPG